MLVHASALIAQILPWPFALRQHEGRAGMYVRDLKHNIDIDLPWSRPANPQTAAREIAETLVHYRCLLDIWHGRRRIIWS